MRRLALLWIAVPVLLYALLVVVIALQQDMLVFPGAGRGDRGVPQLPRLRVDSLPRAGGARFRLAIAEPEASPTFVALVFCGNGEDLYSGAAQAFEWAQYGALGIGVEHPGYGGSEGPPSVETLYAAADAALACARERADQLRVPLVAIGTSLGTFCAVHCATTGRCDRLVLRAPPSSLLAAAQKTYWWLPVALLLKHRFDNLAQAPLVQCPALVVHGDRDSIVPMEQGRAVHAAMGGRAEFLVAEGCGHNDISFDREGPFGSTLARFVRS